MCRHIKKNIPGIHIPDWLSERMEKEGRAGGVRTAAELIQDLQQVVKGAHIMPVDSVSLVDEVLNYSLD